MSTLRGVSTVTYWAADMIAAKQWYTDMLGVAPYFERPGYMEFRIGDYQHELGIIDANYSPGGPATSPGGAVAYWHVDDVTGTVDRLLSMGATEYEKETGRGPGFITASVVDPFGNILGIMSNAHYLEILSDFLPAAKPGGFRPGWPGRGPVRPADGYVRR